jgi:cytoskeletal protein CcmA (bactofilin family)
MGDRALKIINPEDPHEAGKVINTIAEGSTFEGTLKSSRSFAVDGTVIGQISTRDGVAVTNSGILRGEVDCYYFELAGACEGRAQVDSVAHIQAQARLNGDISCRALVVESGAKVDGRLRTHKYRG